MENVLFVCTGNTCRSPIAAAILKNKKFCNVEVKSAGIYATDGQAASQHAQTVLQKNNIEIDHSAKMLDETDLEWATVVLTMTTGHKREITLRYPQFVDRVYTLKEYATEGQIDVVDPFGGNEQDYLETFQDLQKCIEKLIALQKYE